MNTYSLTHLSDRELLRDLAALVARDRATTAALLAHIAEVDDRRLYVPAGYPSMFAYCVHELRLSEDAAFKRIRAARTARRFPAIFAALAEGRLHLSGLVLLASYLTPENANELLAAAAHRSRSELEQLLAERFPGPEMMTRVEAIPSLSPTPQVELAPGPVEAGVNEHPSGRAADQLAPGPVGASSRSAPEATGRVPLHITLAPGTRDKLFHARELLGHELRSGDPAQVLDRALDALIEQLERRQLAATRRLRRSQRPSADPRHVPAHVRRDVWGRDGGQYTFVSDAGRRCPARKFLEFDHVEPVARGGQASVAGLRLRCRAHNQFEAECTFGAGFMHQKREAARRAVEARQQGSAARATPAEPSKERDVVPWLRQLGFRADEARRAAVHCESIPDAPLEQRVRLALALLSPPQRRSQTNLGMAT